MITQLSFSYEGGMLAFHRPDFQRVLIDHLSGVTCRAFTRKRLVSYTQRTSTSYPTVTLQLEDGTTAPYDLLIAADGVKSAARRTMVQELAAAAAAHGKPDVAQKLRDAGHPKWSGTLAYRATIPSEKLRSLIPNHRVLENPVVVSAAFLCPRHLTPI